MRRAGRLRLEARRRGRRRASSTRVAEWMADALVAALTQRPVPHAVEHLYLTDPLADLGAHRRRHVLRRRRRIRLRPRGRATSATWAGASAAPSRERLDAGALPWPLLPAGECIRATALGASEYSVQLSRQHHLHLRARASCCRAGTCRCCSRRYVCGEAIDAGDARARDPRALRRLRSRWKARREVALAFRWHGAPSLRAPRRLRARASPRRCRTPSSAGKPLYLMLDGDVAQTLGAILREELRRRDEILVIDGIDAVGLRLHRPRPHPHAVVHRAGDDQVAGVQRGPAHAAPSPAHPSSRPSSPRPRSCTTITISGHGHDHGHDHDSVPGFDVAQGHPDTVGDDALELLARTCAASTGSG